MVVVMAMCEPQIDCGEERWEHQSQSSINDPGGLDGRRPLIVSIHQELCMNRSSRIDEYSNGMVGQNGVRIHPQDRSSSLVSLGAGPC